MNNDSIINNVQVTGHVYRGPIQLASSWCYYMRLDNGAVAKIKTTNDNLELNKKILVDGILDSSWASSIQASVLYIVACTIRLMNEQ